jgi:hypothetical protein
MQRLDGYSQRTLNLKILRRLSVLCFMLMIARLNVVWGRLQQRAQSNNGMHPTANSAVFIR